MKQNVVLDVVFFIWRNAFMYDVKNLLSKIINDGFMAKINYRVVNGKYVLFINIRKMVDGVMRQKTKRIGVLSGVNKKEDLEILNEALQIRQEYEKTKGIDQGILENESEKMYLVDFIESFAEKYKNKGTRVGLLTLNYHIKRIFGDNVLVSQVDNAF